MDNFKSNKIVDIQTGLLSAAHSCSLHPLDNESCTFLYLHSNIPQMIPQDDALVATLDTYDL
jgi:hypothetical protein